MQRILLGTLHKPSQEDAKAHPEDLPVSSPIHRRAPASPANIQDDISFQNKRILSVIHAIRNIRPDHQPALELTAGPEETPASRQD